MLTAKPEPSPYSPVPAITANRELELRQQSEQSAERKTDSEYAAPPATGPGVPADTTSDHPFPPPGGAITVSKLPDDPPLLAALRCFLDKRPEDAVSRLKGFEQANQEMLLSLLPLAARLTEGSVNRMNTQEMGALLDGLNQIQTNLQPHAPLAIQKICFCRAIATFGVYEPLPPEHRFRRGDRVQVYVELRNFTSQEIKLPSGYSKHVIDLVSSAEILDVAGNKAWPHPIVFQRKGPKADESLTRRQDYFDNYGFYVPDIPPGLYTLWIQVEDRGTNPPRTVRGSLDFHVTNLPGQGT